jgi:hypothetical protein
MFELGFIAASRRTHWTLRDHRTQVSSTFQSNWTGQGARGKQREASCPVLQAGGWPEELLVTGQGHNEDAAVTHPTPPLPQPLEDPLGEFPSLRHVHRVKPQRKWCPIARAMLGSAELLPRLRRATARYAATSPAPPQSSTPRSTTEIRSPIPFHFNKIQATYRRINGREWSTLSWTHDPRPWTRSMGSLTKSTRFSIENNSIIK